MTGLERLAGMMALSAGMPSIYRLERPSFDLGWYDDVPRRLRRPVKRRKKSPVVLKRRAANRAARKARRNGR